MLKDAIEAFKNNPLLALLMALGWIFSGVVTVYTEKQKTDAIFVEKILDAERKIVVAQVKLEKLQESGINDIQPFFQQIVDTFETPAWVKYLDYTNQKFYFVVTNNLYSEVYGTPFRPRGKSDIELYIDNDLSPEQRANILQYALNDRKAVLAGIGRCILINEYAFPVGSLENKKYLFRKCALANKAQTYVLGYQVK